jgi:mono/diheme cytochrome c family protein
MVHLSRPSLYSVILLSLASLAIPAPAASSKEDAEVQSGAILFRDKGCAYCHGPALAGTIKGPALADIRKDKSWPPEKMTDHILNGGQKMPPFRESLTDDQIAQIVTYLRAAKRPLPPPLPAGSSAQSAPTPAPQN